MTKIDRLGWADGMSFNAYGVRLGVRVNDPAILPGLIRYCKELEALRLAQFTSCMMCVRTATSSSF